MTISLLLKNGNGALFLNKAGKSNDPAAGALQGFVDFEQGDDGAAGRIRLEGTARIVSMNGQGLRYQLAFARGLAGFMLLHSRKGKQGDPDYLGFVGAAHELVVNGWNRTLDGRDYVLLNLRENHSASAVRLLSSI